MLQNSRVRVLLLPLLILCASAAGGCDQLAELTGRGDESSSESGDETTPPHEFAVIKMKTGGEIRVRFFPDKAPNHVLNFKRLAGTGVYDGTLFHRVIAGFMIQGGDPFTKDDDPANDGLGGPGYTIPAEFNNVSHVRGIVSMARAGDPDSAGSQFFIMVADRQPRPGGARWSDVLDGKYTAFGEVISGMEIADRVAAVPTTGRNNLPTREQVISSVRIYRAEPGVAGSGP